MIHSVDSVRLAREIDKQAKKHGRVIDVLVEINSGAEENKSGVLPEEAEALCLEISQLLSRDPEFSVEGAESAASVGEVLKLLREVPPEDICIIGGASIYEAFLPYCRTAQVTKTMVDGGADRPVTITNPDGTKQKSYGCKTETVGKFLFLKCLKDEGYEFVFISDLILKDNYEIKHDGTQCKIKEYRRNNK